MRAVLGALLIPCLAAACATPEYNAPEVSQQEVAKQSGPRVPVRAVPRSLQAHRMRVARVEARLREVADPVCYEVSKSPCNFHVVVKQGDSPNAYATENGKVVLFTGLLDYLTTDDEIAAVLAHEVSHHAANHLAEDAQNMALGGLAGGLILGVLVAAAGGSPAAVNSSVDVGMSAGMTAGKLSYSKAQENEADYLGAYMMARAGYDVAAAVAVHDKLGRLVPGANDVGKSFAATHPSSPEREARLTKAREEIALKRALQQNLLPKRRAAPE